MGSSHPCGRRRAVGKLDRMTVESEGAAGIIPVFTLGDRLRKARQVTGLEQEDFAAEIGVSRGTVRNYETGATTRVKPIVLKAWALRSGVPLHWIQTGESPRQGDPDGGSRDTVR